MKKVLFLMLFLVILGAASVKAQVRIGGNTAPNAAAALDLNATDAINNGTKGLALPRVNLTANNMQLTTGVANLAGMLVYNTTATLGAGIYFWSGSQWVVISGDGVVGNGLMDTIAGGGLNKTGTGTAANPYKVGIKTGGVVTGMIADKAVTLAKINTVAADSGKMLMSNGLNTIWASEFGSAKGNFDTLSLLSNRPTVTFTKIVDTTWVLDRRVAVGDWSYIYIPGLTQSDFCQTVSNFAIIASAGTNVININRPFGPALVAGNSGRVKCYRPSI